MPLLDRIRTSGANPVTSRESSGWMSWPFSIGASKTGLAVNNERAMGLPAAYRGVQLLASLCGGLPVDIYEKDDSGLPIEVNDERNAYLWRKPNPEMKRMNFFELSFGQEVLGNCFWYVEKDVNGQPAELWPVENSRVRVGRNGSGVKVYELDGEALPFIDYSAGGEIVHIMNFSNNGLVGYNPFRLAAEALAIGLSAQEYAARFFSEADTPPGYISTDQILTPDQSQKLSETWHKYHAGLRRSQRIAVLSGGSKFFTTGIDPQSAQLKDARRFQNNEVATLLGLPPFLLGEVDRSTSYGSGSGLEEQNRGLMTFTVNAHLTRFQDAINDDLLVRELTGRYVKFNTGAALRGNQLQRDQAHKLQDYKTINEKRAEEELPPVQGGDQILAMTNQVPLDKLDEMAMGADGGGNVGQAAGGQGE